MQVLATAAILSNAFESVDSCCSINSAIYRESRALFRSCLQDGNEQSRALDFPSSATAACQFNSIQFATDTSTRANHALVPETVKPVWRSRAICLCCCQTMDDGWSTLADPHDERFRTLGVPRGSWLCG